MTPNDPRRPHDPKDATTDSLTLLPGALTLQHLQAIHAGLRPLRLDNSCWPGVQASAEVVRRWSRPSCA
jgi:hypothetical protein